MARQAQVTITIGRFGERAKKVKVPKGASVKEVLKIAGFDLSSTEKIWKGGEKVGPTGKLGENAILNVVGSYAGGSC